MLTRLGNDSDLRPMKIALIVEFGLHPDTSICPKSVGGASKKRFARI